MMLEIFDKCSWTDTSDLKYYACITQLCSLFHNLLDTSLCRISTLNVLAESLVVTLIVSVNSALLFVAC